MDLVAGAMLVAGGAWIASSAIGLALWSASSVRRRSLASAPAMDLSPEAFEVTFRTADGMRIEGVLAPPRGNAPVLILQHGQGGTRDSALVLGRPFAAAGYGVLAFDWRAHGRSGGRWIHFGAHEHRDLTGAVEFLATHAGTRGRPVGVYACSLGAAAAAMAAPDLGPQVGAMVLDCAYGCLGRMTAYRLSHLPAVRFPAKLAIDFAGRLVSGTTPGSVVPERNLAAFAPRPLMVCHGTLDRVIPVDEGRRVFASYPGPKEYWESDDDGHVSARETKSREWLARVAGFFARHLREAPGMERVLEVARG